MWKYSITKTMDTIKLFSWSNIKLFILVWSNINGETIIFYFACWINFCHNFGFHPNSILFCVQVCLLSLESKINRCTITEGKFCWFEFAATTLSNQVLQCKCNLMLHTITLEQWLCLFKLASSNTFCNAAGILSQQNMVVLSCF